MFRGDETFQRWKERSVEVLYSEGIKVILMRLVSSPEKVVIKEHT
jgi:hypothetical protein